MNKPDNVNQPFKGINASTPQIIRDVLSCDVESNNANTPEHVHDWTTDDYDSYQICRDSTCNAILEDGVIKGDITPVKEIVVVAIDIPSCPWQAEVYGGLVLGDSFNHVIEQINQCFDTDMLPEGTTITLTKVKR